MTATASTALRRGACLCRKVNFTLNGPPARMIQCNCLNCQTSSGSAFMTNMLYKKDNYKITSGESLVKIFKDKDTDSKAEIERAFCSECGSNLSMRNVTNPKMADNVVVCAGGVEGNHESFKPQSELFGHRRHGWVPEVKRPEKKKEAKM